MSTLGLGSGVKQVGRRRPGGHRNRVHRREILPQNGSRTTPTGGRDGETEGRDGETEGRRLKTSWTVPGSEDVGGGVDGGGP